MELEPVRESDANPVLHLLAPVVAIGATMLVRRALNSGYRRVTGSPAPSPGERDVALGRALMWAIVTAATAAAVEVAVYRIVNRPTTR